MLNPSLYASPPSPPPVQHYILKTSESMGTFPLGKMSKFYLPPGKKYLKNRAWVNS
jgi:hypothetical protein